MTRVSQEELYNDKDVITQILKLKDTVNDYAGGIIENIDVSGNNLVIDWASGESISLPLPNPTGISSIAGVVSGGNLTITIYMTDGSSHAFTTPLAGMASEAYVDTLDAQNVKLTGNQTIADVKTFIGSANVPTVPADLLGASSVNEAYVNDATDGVNNIAHKSGDEIITGIKTFPSSDYQTKIRFRANFAAGDAAPYTDTQGYSFVDKDGTVLMTLFLSRGADKKVALLTYYLKSDGTYDFATIFQGA